MKHRIERREFLRRAGLLAGGSLSLSASRALAARSAPRGYGDLTDYKTLVCVYLSGGNDVFNMLVPYAAADYSAYADLRQAIAVPHADLLPLGVGDMALHPSLPDARALFEQDRLAIVANAGMLIEPLTLEQYQEFVGGGDPGVEVPPDLYSHSHQTEMWHTLRVPQPGQRHPGWGGAMADLLVEANEDRGLPPSFTMRGANAWQASRLERTAQFALHPQVGVTEFEDLNHDGWPAWEPSRSAAWDQILAQPHAHPLLSQASSSFTGTRERVAALQEALLLSEGNIGTPYDDLNALAQQLRMAARLIYAREHLGMKRQILFVSAGAWDTHGSQAGDHSDLLAMLNHALHSFYLTTVELGVADSVTTFVGSEFGRTLATNGDGTDHGWGTHYLVLGDSVVGGRIHGELPVLELGGPDDAGNAILPRLGTDPFGSTLAKWMGIAAADRPTVFPNLMNFPSDDLGFMM